MKKHLEEKEKEEVEDKEGQHDLQPSHHYVPLF